MEPSPARWEKGELPDSHYLRFKGETEQDRLERLIEVVSKWVNGADGGVWQKELNRLKKELQLLQP